jgi:hypothetical protein
MLSRHLATLLLDSLNQRFDAHFQRSDEQHPEPVEGLVASDGAHRVGLYIAPLWEEDAAWSERLRAAEERLDAFELPGAYLLWVPPRAAVPLDEPDARHFAERVRAAAESLAPGGRIEVMFPVTVRLAKLREEGGYASVVGGLSRWWTRVTENVQGTFSVDSSALHRLTLDGMVREELWPTIGRLSKGIDVGQSAEFEIDEAWTLQRLPDGTEGPALSLSNGPALSLSNGFALIGAPPTVDPTEGILVRRVARKRLAAAKEALGPLDVELRAVGFVGAYEYAEVETASGTVKAIDPALYSRLAVVSLLVDGEVRPIFAPKSLPWA